ncbi:MAG: hypothetical protein M3158_02190 [Pseudomonadota bacterium]|jgi:hypothetical protein|nr:hypothetical protein [Pseudomonadota bacterium]
MEYSLLIAHQVADPSGRGARVEQLIESLGEWIQIQRSLYILWTCVSPQEVHERIRETMDDSDLLAVADINEGFVSNYGALVNSFLRSSLTMDRSGIRIGRASGPH